MLQRAHPRPQTQCLLAAVSSSVRFRTSWNWASARSKCVPSQNTFPQRVQMKYSGMRVSRPGGTVSSCTSAPLLNLKEWASRDERGAQRLWGAKTGPSGALQRLESTWASHSDSQSSRLGTECWIRPEKEREIFYFSPFFPFCSFLSFLASSVSLSPSFYSFLLQKLYSCFFCFPSYSLALQNFLFLLSLSSIFLFFNIPFHLSVVFGILFFPFLFLSLCIC